MNLLVGSHTKQNKIMKREFKTYREHSGVDGIVFFIKYMGALVEGQCKWYVWSPDFDFEPWGNLFHTKDEARISAMTAVFTAKHGQYQG
jgi:hypothetical protein